MRPLFALERRQRAAGKAFELEQTLGGFAGKQRRQVFALRAGWAPAGEAAHINFSSLSVGCQWRIPSKRRRVSLRRSELSLAAFSRLGEIEGAKGRDPLET